MKAALFLFTWTPMLFTLVAAAAVSVAIYQQFNEEKEKQYRERESQGKQRESVWPKCVICKKVAAVCGRDKCARCNLSISKAENRCPKKCAYCKEMECKVKIEPCDHLCQKCGTDAVSEDCKCPVCHSKITGPDEFVKNILYPKKCMLCYSEELVRNSPCGCSSFCEEHISLCLEEKCPICKTEITNFTRI